MVTVVPVTHAAPSIPETAVEIPLATKRRLGLDDAPSFIVASEGNRFAWPGPDLRLTPAARIDYGFLPPALYRRVQERLVAHFVARRLLTVPRTD